MKTFKEVEDEFKKGKPFADILLTDPIH